MPDEPEIDFEKLKAGDEGEWERAYPALYQAGLKVACGYRAQMGEADEDDFIIQAVTKAYAEIAKKTSFKHLCNFVATATKHAISDELKSRKALMHGDGKVVSLDAKGFGIVDENDRPGSGDGQPDSEQPSDEDSGNVGPEHELGFRKRMRPDEACHLRLLRDIHANAFIRIERRYSNVVSDFYLDNLTYEEIAKRRGLSINSVGVYIRRGLDAMFEFVPERDKTAWWHKDERDPP